MRTSRRLSNTLLVAGAAAALGLTGAACSDDDSADSDATATTVVTGDAEAPEGESSDDASTSDGYEDEIGLGTYVTGLSGALPSAEVELVDEGTIKMTFSSGSVEMDGIVHCTIANNVLPDDATAIVSYPDGEQNCD